MRISEPDAWNLFNLFDIDWDGWISYDEFLRTVVGEMNEFRKELVRTAFKKFDRDGNGRVELNDIKNTYSAANHPDVKNGRRTEDEILMEFLDTFELHHWMRHQSAKDSFVTLEEFIEYYNNISCSIDNDETFELMINNSWNLKNRNYARGWAY